VIRSPFPDIEFPDIPLPEFVLARAAERGDKPALIDAPSGRAITYEQLAAAVRAGAGGLADRGFGQGEVFAHYAPNLPEYAVAPEAGEWLQQATLAIRARVPLEVLRDVIQPFPTFSEIHMAALKALRHEIALARNAVGAEA